MNLSDEQKKMCIAIRDGKIKSSFDFIFNYGIIKECDSINDSTILLKIGTSSIHHYDLNLEQKSIDTILDQINEFAALWFALEKNVLIMSYQSLDKLEFSKESDKIKDYLSNRLEPQPDNKSFKKLNQTLADRAHFVNHYNNIFSTDNYNNKEISILPAFKDFIKDDKFLTEEEIKFEEQQEHNRKTRLGTFIALLISSAIAIFSLIINCLNYFHQRDVESTNLQRKVEIINLDSAMIKYEKAINGHLKTDSLKNVKQEDGVSIRKTAGTLVKSAKRINK